MPPAYNYNELTATIAEQLATARNSKDEERQTALTTAVEAFETLSKHCPMTPLLWIQYAAAAAALVGEDSLAMRVDLLDLGLLEFPSSALLQYHRCRLQADAATLEAALDAVGRGSHRNEDAWVVELYRMQAKIVDDKQESLVERALTPMAEHNQTLSEEAGDEYRDAIDEARRTAARVWSRFASYEDEIDVRLQQQGLLEARQHVMEVSLGTEEDWIWQPHKFGMGLGGMELANGYMSYARAVSSYANKRRDDEEEEELPQGRLEIVVQAIYERGVAECPTVEALWVAYLRHLSYHLKKDASIGSRLVSVGQRAVRNCPYSLALARQRLSIAATLAASGQAVFDPDTVLETVQSVLDAGFLPDTAALELYLEALRVVKRRVLEIVGGADYEEPLAVDTKKLPNTKPMDSDLSDEAQQEMQDLLDDWTEMFEEVENRLRKTFKTLPQARTILYKERASTEKFLLWPLSSLEDEDAPKVTAKDDKILLWLDKAVRGHNPPHPETYLAYIHRFMDLSPTCEAHVVARLRQIRYLYQKAVLAAGRPKQLLEVCKTPALHEFGVSFSVLSEEWVDFEHSFGTEKSIAQAMKDIQHKTQKIGSQPSQESANGMPTDQTPTVALPSKRKANDDADAEQLAKRTKSENIVQQEQASSTGLADGHNDVGTKAEVMPSKKPQKAEYKVRVGKLEYPAHPFTVRVSNLSPDTEDMDLVDTFRPKCGAVVHARIIREKMRSHGEKAKSKGWGLVQFEERESVDKALALNDVIGLHEKTLLVDRSHVPAALLVPPGMHRIREKGQGKYSKRNEKRKEHGNEDDGAPVDGRPISETKPPPSGDKPAAAAGANMLAFRPRSIGRKTHQKPKISFSGAAKSASNDKE